MADLPDGNPHIDAVIDRLEATVSSTLPVHDGQSPNLSDTPYLVVYAEPGVASYLTLAGVSSHFNLVFIVHGVGGTRWEAGWAADKARDALLDVILTVAGRNCRPIRQEVAQPARKDVDHPDLWLAVAGYRLTSD